MTFEVRGFTCCSCIDLKNIARTVHGSDLPEEVSRLLQEFDDGTGRPCSEQDVIEKLGDPAVILQPRGDGTQVLQVT